MVGSDLRADRQRSPPRSLASLAYDLATNPVGSEIRPYRQPQKPGPHRRTQSSPRFKSLAFPGAGAAAQMMTSAASKGGHFLAAEPAKKRRLFSLRAAEFRRRFAMARPYPVCGHAVARRAKVVSGASRRIPPPEPAFSTNPYRIQCNCCDCG